MNQRERQGGGGNPQPLKGAELKIKIPENFHDMKYSEYAY